MEFRIFLSFDHVCRVPSPPLGDVGFIVYGTRFFHYTHSSSMSYKTPASSKYREWVIAHEATSPEIAPLFRLVFLYVDRRGTFIEQA